MLASFNPILNIGLRRCNPLEVHHLRMVNLLGLLCTAGTLVFSALYLFAFKSVESAFFNALFAALYLLSWLLTREGLLTIAKYWLFVVFFAQQTVFSYFVLSANSENELLLLVVPTIVVLLFEPRDRLPRYSLSIIALFLLYLTKSIPHPDPLLFLSDTNARAAYLSVILIFICSSAVLMDFYLLDLDKINKESRKLVFDDLLTGTLNSQSLYDNADTLFTQHRNSDIPLSILVIDLDEFSQINMIHGWPIGNRVLQHMAGLLSEHLDDGMVIGRLHTDRFAILMPALSLQQARQKAEKLRISVMRSVVLMDHTAIKRTASVGVSAFDETVIAGHQLVDNAIEAMSNAKKRGKNKVCYYSPKNMHILYREDRRKG